MENRTIKIFGLKFWESRSGDDLENPSVNLDEAVDEAFDDGKNIVVNENTVYNLSSVWRAVNLLSGTLAALPLHVYRREENSRFVNREHPVFTLLHDHPNGLMNAFSFRQTMMVHLLLWGNFYARIIRDAWGQPISLKVYRPKEVSPIKSGENLYYQVPDRKRRVWAIDMIHVVGFTDDGIKGKSVIRYARDSFGLGLTLQELGKNFYNNNANLGGVIEHPKALKDTAYQRLRRSWKRAFAGVKKSGETAILEEGATYKNIGMPLEDAQFLGSRKFNVTEVARWFGIPPHKLADLDRSTNNNIEHQGIEYVTDSVLLWCKRIEVELNRKLFREDEKKTLFVEHNLAGLLRGDSKARADYYAKMIQWGVMTRDEARILENMNPMGGEAAKLLQPLNMALVEQQKKKEGEE